ncbi:hypothetical protein BC830DRAFT_741897 [Chytriomyces sp. MP71]|nr:hypothetical protein BC830DRAFT_741897 [Chytriomyces sp. MP71]
MERKDFMSQEARKIVKRPERRTACNRCNLHHSKCDRLTPACSRCKRAGKKCVYEGINSASPRHRSSSPRSQSPIQIPRFSAPVTPPEDLFHSLLESRSARTLSHRIEDVSVLPSIHGPDGALITPPRLSDSSCLLLTPSMDTVRSLIVITKYQLFNGLACEHSMNQGLTDFEKEQRRCLWWDWYTVYKTAHCILSSNFKSLLVIDPPAVRPLHNCNSPNRDSGLILSPVSAICHQAALLDVIGDIKDLYSAPSTSTSTLLSSDHHNFIKNKLNHVLLCISPTPVLTDLVITDRLFDADLPKNDGSQSGIFSDTLMISLLYNAAVCMLNRPRLYLTFHLPLESFTTPRQIDSILESVHASLTAARNISHIVEHLSKRVVQFQWTDNPLALFSLLEATTTLWFMTCRTQSYWWWKDSGKVAGQVLSMTPEDRRLLREGVCCMVNVLKSADAKWKTGSKKSMVASAVIHVTAMLNEMSRVENALTGHIVAIPCDVELPFKNAVGLEGLPLSKHAPVLRFMGLLGASVPGILSFDEPEELLWALFYERYRTEAITCC